MKFCVFGCFDSKFQFLKQIVKDLQKRGHEVVMVHVGVMPPSSKPNFPIIPVLDEMTMNRFLRFKDKTRRNQVEGLRLIYEKCTDFFPAFLSEHTFDGFITAAGSQTTDQAILILQRLITQPNAIKVLITSLHLKIETSAIIVLPSITCIFHINILLKAISNHVAKLVSKNAMVNENEQSSEVLYLRQFYSLSELQFQLGSMISPDNLRRSSRNRIGLTVSHGTRICVERCAEILLNDGFEVMLFEADGIGGQMLAFFIDADYISGGLIDITIKECTDKLFGGVQAAGRCRFLAAGKAGLPLILVPGGIDTINYWLGHVPVYRRSNACIHVGYFTMSRTNRKDNERIGKFLADIASKSKGPLAIVIPETFSNMGGPGRPLHNSDVDFAFGRSLRQNLDKDVDIVDYDGNINQPEFADILVKNFNEMHRIYMTNNEKKTVRERLI